MMKNIIDYDLGDISIKKVSNGWILLEGSPLEEGKVIFSAYESKEVYKLDKSDSTEDAESLKRLLEDVFSGYLRSKHCGGLEIKFHESGYEIEDQE